jgi:hypothetical protein
VTIDARARTIGENLPMTTVVEVFADITCPFTHVGLKQVVRHVDEMDEPADVIVCAWPLEWVNGSPLDVDAVLVKAAALTEQLGVDDFGGLRADAWPTSTIPALDLAASGYARDAATGLAVSLELRRALFERGQNRPPAHRRAPLSSRTTPTVSGAACGARPTSSSATMRSSAQRSISVTTPTDTSRLASTARCSPTSSRVSTPDRRLDLEPPPAPHHGQRRQGQSVCNRPTVNRWRPSA